mgnify:CR=1 FL=1
MILTLKEENTRLKKNEQELKVTIETLLLRIEELERIVFGNSGGGRKATVEKAKEPLKNSALALA